MAALVEQMTADSVTVTLVNLNQLEARTVTVQGGAYAEHQIEGVTVEGERTAVDADHFTLRLDPGCGAQLQIDMRRYANQPTFAFPWSRA